MRNISRLKHKVTGVNIIFSKSVFASIFPTILKENIINKIHTIILPVVFSDKYFLYKSTYRKQIVYTKIEINSNIKSASFVFSCPAHK